MSQPAKSPLSRFPLLTSDQLPAVREATARFWPPHESEIVGEESYTLVMNRVLLGDIAITFVACTAGVRVTPQAPNGEACLVLPLTGSVEIETDERLERATPAHPLLRTSGWVRRFEATPSECLMVDIPFSALAAATDAPLGLPLPHRRLTGEQATALRSHTLRLARTANTNSRLELLQTLSQSDRKRLLSTALKNREKAFLSSVAAIWTSPEPAASPLDLDDASDVATWLAQHALSREPLAELARRAGRSMRSIQRACRRLGATPQEVLRTVRLDRAHEMLEQATASLSVAAVAEAVGYPHVGRFAAYYRERFREMPSETLSRNRKPQPSAPPAAAPAAESPA